MDASAFQARWELQDLPSEDLPAVAAQLLQAGIESPDVVELAGMTRPIRSEAAPVVARALAELGLPPMDRTAALWRLAYEYARRIADSEIPPRDGAGALWGICNDLGLPEALRYFVYLAADYGEGPDDPQTEAAWFDAKITECARDLLARAPAALRSAPAA
jgi:hypothetical protein